MVMTLGRLPACGSRSKMNCRYGAWLSLVERCVRDAEVAGSNPVAPTAINLGKRLVSRGFLRSWYRSTTHPNCPQLTVICTDCQILVQILEQTGEPSHRPSRLPSLRIVWVSCPAKAPAANLALRERRVVADRCRLKQRDRPLYRTAGRRNEDLSWVGPAAYARMSCRTSPSTSVSRKSRPLNR